MKPLFVVPVTLVFTVSMMYVGSLKSADIKNSSPSICESSDVIIVGLPKAISEKLAGVGDNINTSDIEITNIAESHAVEGSDETVCHAGLIFQRSGKEERYLIDYRVKYVDERLSVAVSRINEL